ncbi:MAG: hypothetical protein JW732_03250 [Dehalococcoidia bacterium]|nr:hypothetical protein [Dehalococcoidia bacterium]
MASIVVDLKKGQRFIAGNTPEIYVVSQLSLHNLTRSHASVVVPGGHPCSETPMVKGYGRLRIYIKPTYISLAEMLMALSFGIWA